MKNFKEHFRQLARQNLTTITDVIVLAAYKALNAKSNTDKLDIFISILGQSFTPVTNPIKLANGQTPHQKLKIQLAGGRIWFSDGSSTNTLKQIVEKEVSENAEEILMFLQLFANALDRISDIRETQYSYVFVNPGLSASQRIVQTNHAAIELGHELNRQNISIKDLHLVLCPLTDANAISNLLSENNIANVKFQEPDLHNQVTAIATWPVARSRRSVLRKFPLLA